MNETKSLGQIAYEARGHVGWTVEHSLQRGSWERVADAVAAEVRKECKEEHNEFIARCAEREYDLCHKLCDAIAERDEARAEVERLRKAIAAMPLHDTPSVPPEHELQAEIAKRETPQEPLKQCQTCESRCCSCGYCKTHKLFRSGYDTCDAWILKMLAPGESPKQEKPDVFERANAGTLEDPSDHQSESCLPEKPQEPVEQPDWQPTMRLRYWRGQREEWLQQQWRRGGLAEWRNVEVV